MRFRLLGQYVNVSMAILVAVDAVVFFFSARLGSAVMRRFDPEAMTRHGWPLWITALLLSASILLGMLAFGLYSSRQRARLSGVFVRQLTAISAATVATAAVLYLVPELRVGRGVLMTAAALCLVGESISRGLFARVVDEDLFKRQVLVYGVGQRTAALSSLRRRSDRRGFNIVGYVQPEGEAVTVGSAQVLPSDDLLDLCKKHDVDEIVVAMEDRRRAFPISDLLRCRLSGIDVSELLTFLERETGRVRIDVLNPSWIIFGEGFRRDPIRLFTSRALDVAASLVLVILVLPLMLLTALAIKLEDGLRAPVFYRQERVGLGGRPFPLVKFRSMRIDAERDGRAQWAQKSDPRVTRIGSIIRKLRIDELPQILNVLAGHMSFVGPRPERPQFVAQLSDRIPYYVQRHCVKPGITGWAQLCYPYGSSDEDALEKLQYDLYYIKNNNLLFDLAILVQTAEVVFMGKGAR